MDITLFNGRTMFAPTTVSHKMIQNFVINIFPQKKNKPYERLILILLNNIKMF